MCFKKQPFKTKENIINGKYRIPKNCKFSSKILDLIRMCLKINPNERLDIHLIIKYFKKLGLIDPNLIPSNSKTRT